MVKGGGRWRGGRAVKAGKMEKRWRGDGGEDGETVER